MKDLLTHLAWTKLMNRISLLCHCLWMPGRRSLCGITMMRNRITWHHGLKKVRHLLPVWQVSGASKTDWLLFRIFCQNPEYTRTCTVKLTPPHPTSDSPQFVWGKMETGPAIIFERSFKVILSLQTPFPFQVSILHLIWVLGNFNTCWYMLWKTNKRGRRYCASIYRYTAAVELQCIVD